MAGKTYAMSDTVLNMFASGTFPTVSVVPATTYAALMTTNPTVDDMTSAVETTYTSYTRASIVSTATGWNAPASSAPARIITNKIALNFTTAGSGPVTITGFCMVFHSTPGGGAITVVTVPFETFYWNVLTGGNQVINNGNPVTAAIAALVISED